MSKITPEEFFNNDEVKVDIFKAKYAKSGESVDECFNRIASEISNSLYNDEKERDYWTERWTQELLDDKWRPGGSITASTNNPEKHISNFNCTADIIEEDSLESIFEVFYNCGKIAAYRQGVGVDFSNTRPKGSFINNAAEVSEGAINWMKLYDNLGKTVGQRGRIPAILFSLKVTHPDIEEFISCKDDINVINNANISVQITDDFMEAVTDDTDWTMSFQIEDGDLIEKTIKARKLMRMIAEHSHATAEPGVQFIDLMKQYSILEAMGYPIVATNACSEAPLPKNGVCLLSSINVGKVPAIDDEDFNDYIKETAYSLIRFLDNVAQYELNNTHKSPLMAQYKSVEDLRQVGIGVTNLHAWVYKQGFGYDSDEGVDAIEYFFRVLFYWAFTASLDLAKERGACPAWQKISNHEEMETKFLTRFFDEFPELRDEYRSTGLRNSSLLSVAPTGSLSLTFSDDILSTGIEPLIGRYYWQKTRALSKGNYYDYYFRIPETVKKLVLEAIDDHIDIYGSANVAVEIEHKRIISEFPGSVLDNNGKVGKELISIIDLYIKPEQLRTAYEIDPFKKVDMMSRVQKYVDAAISVTFNLPKDYLVDDIEKLYIKAYEQKLKAMSIYRDGCREGILIFEFPKTPKEKEVVISEVDTHRPTEVKLAHAPKRPKTLPCEVFNTFKHKVLVGLMEDKPYEMFIVDTDVKLPGTAVIKKNSKRKYSVIKDGEVLIDNIVADISNEVEMITRLISSNLRHGAPIDYLIQTLQKLPSEENKYCNALGNVLKKYSRLILESVGEQLKCEYCGEILVKHGGCYSCMNCGKGGKCSI